MPRNGLPPTPNAKSTRPRNTPKGLPKRKKKKALQLPLSDALVEQGIMACKGNLQKVAEAVGQPRQRIHEYIYKQDEEGNYARPELVSLLATQREVRIDNAEHQLDQATDRGEPWAIALTLRTLGKGRGYVEKQEMEQTEHTIRTTEIVVVHHKADSSPLRVAVGGDAPDSDQERIEAEPASGAAESVGE